MILEFSRTKSHLAEFLSIRPGAEDVGDKVAVTLVSRPAPGTVKAGIIAADELLPRLTLRVVPEPVHPPPLLVPEVLGQTILI